MLHSFVLQKVSFIDAIYDKMGREHVANFWRQLLGQVYAEMGKRLEAELGAGRQKPPGGAGGRDEEGAATAKVQIVVFQEVVFGSLERILSVAYPENRADAKGMQEAFSPVL